MHLYKQYILRTFDLAKLTNQVTSPNPFVGAVIVSNGKVIGEGSTSSYGSNHAEVNAISEATTIQNNLKDTTLFISLEPCCIHGRTPACTNLIIEKQISTVVYSALDKTDGVYSKSAHLLEQKGHQVTFGVLEKQGNELVKIRNTFVSQKRPFIILKYAQSKDGFIGKKNEQIWFTNRFSKTLVHKWRSEVDAIIIGTRTAEIDNPNLTNRLYFGKNPLRIILDRTCKLNHDLQIFNGQAETWIITSEKNIPNHPNIKYISLDFDDQLIPNILKLLYNAKKTSLIVEGGAQLLNSFISANYWDEARVFIAQQIIKEGIPAPQLAMIPIQKTKISQDELVILKNTRIS